MPAVRSEFRVLSEIPVRTIDEQTLQRMQVESMKNKTVRKILKQSDATAHEIHMQHLADFKKIYMDGTTTINHQIEKDTFSLPELQSVSSNINTVNAIKRRLNAAESPVKALDGYLLWEYAHHELRCLIEFCENRHKYNEKFKHMLSWLETLASCCLAGMSTYEPECRAKLKAELLESLKKERTKEKLCLKT